MEEEGLSEQKTRRETATASPFSLLPHPGSWRAWLAGCETAQPTQSERAKGKDGGPFSRGAVAVRKATVGGVPREWSVG